MFHVLNEVSLYSGIKTKIYSYKLSSFQLFRKNLLRFLTFYNIIVLSLNNSQCSSVCLINWVSRLWMLSSLIFLAFLNFSLISSVLVFRYYLDHEYFLKISVLSFDFLIFFHNHILNIQMNCYLFFFYLRKNEEKKHSFMRKVLATFYGSLCVNP